MAKTWSREDSEKMDSAAAQAEAELAGIPEKTLRPVADWWNRWFPDAGHKRLGRVLIQYASKKEETKSA